MITNEQLAQIRAEQGEDAAKAAIEKDREEAEKAKKQKARRENQNFTQIKPKGWAVLQRLMKEDANAARLYAFLAEHMGPDGTLAASRRTLAEALEIGERTVSRHIQTLVTMKSIIVLKMGTANVYCMDPAEVWKSYNNAKPYAAFNTRTLVSKSENPFVRRRLAVLLNGQQPERDLLDIMEDGDDPDTGIDFNDFADAAE